MSKLEKSAQMAEIVAAFAVVASLVYVGWEVRQNTKAVRLANQQSALTLGQHWDDWLRDEGFASVYIEGNADYSALSAAQQLQLEKYIGEGLNIWEFAFASHRSGLINDETWEAWDRHFQGELQAAEVWRLGWAFKRDSYAASFQAHLDAVLADN